MYNDQAQFEDYPTPQAAAARAWALRKAGVRAWCTLDRDAHTAADLFRYRTRVVWMQPAPVGKP